jgi:hypothetical protein
MDVASKTDCISADGNFRQQQARERCQFYSPSRPAKHKGWPRLSEAGLYIRRDAPYLAFELTCIAEPMAWRGCSGQEIWEAQLAYLISIGKRPMQCTNHYSQPLKLSSVPGASGCFQSANIIQKTNIVCVVIASIATTFIE